MPPSKEHATAAFVITAVQFLMSQRNRIIESAVKEPAPSLYIAGREYVEAGGLMTYGVSITDCIPPARATYVDKILKGAKPADLPVGAAH